MSILSATPAAGITLENDWNDGWLQPGDSINSRSWTADPAATLEGVTGPIVKVSDMTAGIDYLVEESVTTSGGESEKRGFMVRCVPHI